MPVRYHGAMVGAYSHSWSVPWSIPTMVPVAADDGYTRVLVAVPAGSGSGRYDVWLITLNNAVRLWDFPSKRCESTIFCLRGEGVPLRCRTVRFC